MGHGHSQDDPKYAQAYFSGADQVSGGSKHALPPPPQFPPSGWDGRGFGGVGKAFRVERSRHTSLVTSAGDENGASPSRSRAGSPSLRTLPPRSPGANGCPNHFIWLGHGSKIRPEKHMYPGGRATKIPQGWPSAPTSSRCASSTSAPRLQELADPEEGQVVPEDCSLPDGRARWVRFRLRQDPRSTREIEREASPSEKVICSPICSEPAVCLVC